MAHKSLRTVFSAKKKKKKTSLIDIWLCIIAYPQALSLSPWKQPSVEVKQVDSGIRPSGFESTFLLWDVRKVT